MAARASNGFVSLPCQFVLQAAKYLAYEAYSPARQARRGPKR